MSKQREISTIQGEGEPSKSQLINTQKENEIYTKQPVQYKQYSFKEKKKFQIEFGNHTVIGKRQVNEDAIRVEVNANDFVPLKNQIPSMYH